MLQTFIFAFLAVLSSLIGRKFAWPADGQLLLRQTASMAGALGGTYGRRLQRRLSLIATLASLITRAWRIGRIPLALLAFIGGCMPVIVMGLLWLLFFTTLSAWTAAADFMWGVRIAALVLLWSHTLRLWHSPLTPQTPSASVFILPMLSLAGVPLGWAVASVMGLLGIGSLLRIKEEDESSQQRNVMHLLVCLLLTALMLWVTLDSPVLTTVSWQILPWDFIVMTIMAILTFAGHHWARLSTFVMLMLAGVMGACLI